MAEAPQASDPSGEDPKAPPDPGEDAGAAAGGRPPAPTQAAGEPTPPDPPGPQESVLSLAQLIGAPITALVDAEARAAMATERFIRSVGFTRDGSDSSGYGKLQMAEFTQSRRTEDGATESVRYQIPLLSMLPIPALQIRHADLDYTVRILQTEAMHQKSDPETADMKLPPDRDPPATLRASFARAPAPGDRRSVDMLVKMKLRIEQADLPAGLARMLAVATESAGPVPLPPESEHE